MFRIKILRNWIISKNPKGIYEYVIARTKYNDEILTHELGIDCAQVFIFGAGFDSRAIRMQMLAPDAKFYELDAPATQEAKIQQYNQRKIPINPNLIFIPVNFEKQKAIEEINKTEYQFEKKTCFLLEGLIMYLTPEAVDETFQTISLIASSGSILVFDTVYTSILKKNEDKYGEEIKNKVAENNESFQFGLELEEVKSFLEKYGWELIELCDAPSLEKKYFTDENGTRKARVNDAHFLVQAKRI
jgi:methyltransferase (TIGR00027 family)